MKIKLNENSLMAYVYMSVCEYTTMSAVHISWSIVGAWSHCSVLANVDMFVTQFSPIKNSPDGTFRDSKKNIYSWFEQHGLSSNKIHFIRT